MGNFYCYYLLKFFQKIIMLVLRFQKIKKNFKNRIRKYIEIVKKIYLDKLDKVDI